MNRDYIMRRDSRRGMDGAGYDSAMYDSRRGVRGSGRRDRYPYEPEYDSRMDYRRDYEYDRMGYDSHYPRSMEYESRGVIRRDYGPDYAKEKEKEYMEDLMEWIHKLSKMDTFNIPKHQIIEQAKGMGIRFDEYTEEEFYATYLMHVSDYKGIGQNHHTYIAMAKKFLEDEDLKISPSEKLCRYLDYIVLASD